MAKMKGRSLQKRDASNQLLGSTRRHHKDFHNTRYEEDIYIFEE